MASPRDVGERSLLLEVDRPAAVAAWVRTAAVARRVPVADVVPAARTVLVTAPTVAGRAGLMQLLTDLPEDVTDLDAPRGEPVQIAVRFDGLDLADVAEQAALSADGVARLLVDTEFDVQFCGFAPGFAYLAGLPHQLRVPRRSEPRVRVPAGSLALADSYAAVYPRESPGGWNLVGSTDAVLFDIDRDPPALLVAGTRVRFVAS
ncbi:allophanate hydrolase subunit 1 [uncultured Jatrophihabitans sp.]|uniref:5-oxoprolinase subunit B family protein n=1 Tax=uncultured Jatrophihabitans sp. TaxID=1610747 RepID=UPI0035CC1CA5